MPAISEQEPELREGRKKEAATCYHCGATCLSNNIAIDDKHFCCEGCKLVYEVINSNGLCDYYDLQNHPGLAQVKPIRKDKYAFLDDEQIANKLYQFTNGDLTLVTLYLPSIHCASCLWLLEHLDRMNGGVSESRVNFTAKEITIHFYRNKTTLRTIVELLATIGYEPYISLEDTSAVKKRSYNKQRIIKLGVAGFCFGNIMMMSFPEYLSGKLGIEAQYTGLFRYLNLLLSLPVFFYSAQEFYQTAWSGLKQKMLNIDTPIVLALIITFSRSVYEILGHTGAGYLDSMSGIVFFMLAGRILQDRTYQSLSFTRDYKSYFPIAVTVQTAAGNVSRQLEDLREKDIVVLHHEEIVPADSVVLNDNARIDYSFVTGEAEPVTVAKGEMVYAGGRQTGEELMLQVAKPIAASYLTSLWNHYAFRKDKKESNDSHSVIHLLSKYFTIILFVLAAITTAYWWHRDPSKIITSISAMLIVACPCALLLAATFTNSNILRIFGLNGLYLRDATVIEQMAKANHIVFDKTGTVTDGSNAKAIASGHQLTETEKDLVYSVVRQSNHPVSKALVSWLGHRRAMPLTTWHEIPGRGIEAFYGTMNIQVGSAEFLGIEADAADKANVYIRLGRNVSSMHLQSAFREAMPALINDLKQEYSLSLLSGDNEKQKAEMQRVFGERSELMFEQKPIDKLNYVQELQAKGKRVIMVGDGLNDAGALQQSNVGITLADDVNNFTPACDVILKADNVSSMQALLDLSKWSGRIINITFVVSILYNFAGLYYSMTGAMKPVVAAILMPCSTLTIVIISSGLSNLVAWRKGLKVADIK